MDSMPMSRCPKSLSSNFQMPLPTPTGTLQLGLGYWMSLIYKSSISLWIPRKISWLYWHTHHQSSSNLWSVWFLLTTFILQVRICIWPPHPKAIYVRTPPQGWESNFELVQKDIDTPWGCRRVAFFQSASGRGPCCVAGQRFAGADRWIPRNSKL